MTFRMLPFSNQVDYGHRFMWEDGSFDSGGWTETKPTHRLQHFFGFHLL